ncbi:hypothetical protein Tco_0262590 [Tanacetum coccineum]
MSIAYFVKLRQLKILCVIRILIHFYIASSTVISLKRPGGIKLESMKILENELESLKLQENQPGDRLMSADVARGHGGDGGGDDRPPPYQVPTGCGGCLGNRGKGTRKPNLGGRRAGRR